MSRRFYVESPITDDRAQLVGGEARHVSRVLRAKVGDPITLFDGQGGEALARIREIRRSVVDLDVLSRIDVDRELPFTLTLGVALPKGDRQRWLVEKATELGVTCLSPLKTHRGVAQPTASALQRLRRTVIEAAKQCGRNRLMQVLPPQSWEEFVGGAPRESERWLAQPETRATPNLLITASRRSPAVYLAVGPEGGFVEQEIALAEEAAWQRISVGPRILRIETAAIALAALVALSRESRGDQ